MAALLEVFAQCGEGDCRAFVTIPAGVPGYDQLLACACDGDIQNPHAFGNVILAVCQRGFAFRHMQTGRIVSGNRPQLGQQLRLQVQTARG